MLANTDLTTTAEIQKEVSRFMLDADISSLRHFLFKAVVLQFEKPELADFIEHDKLSEVRMLYDLLVVMQKSNNAPGA